MRSVSDPKSDTSHPSASLSFGARMNARSVSLAEVGRTSFVTRPRVNAHGGAVRNVRLWDARIRGDSAFDPENTQLQWCRSSWVGSVGRRGHEKRTEDDERELADAILEGAKRRPQAFGSYFTWDGGSCALGAAYEGIHHLPEVIGPLHPRLERLFHCLEDIIRTCPAARRSSTREPDRPPNDDHPGARTDRRVLKTDDLTERPHAR
jgi:hypothetical protein